MRKLFIPMVVFVGFLFSSLTGQAQEYFTLAMALDRVEYHSDYQSWLNSTETTRKSIKTILDKQQPRIELDSGQSGIVSYNYNIDKEHSSFMVSPSLSISKTSLHGTSLTTSVTPSKTLQKGTDWRVGWLVSLRQTIWPSPSLSADRIALSNSDKSLVMLESLEEYVIQSALFKIEELYRSAQLIEARVNFAEKNLQAERHGLQVTLEKVAIGEAGDAELITSKLGVLRSEKELELAKANAKNAVRRLQDAIGLEESITLSPLELESLAAYNIHEISSANLAIYVEEHPLIIPLLVDIEKAKLDLLAAEEALKPGASFSFSFSENQSNERQLRANFNISYPVLDGGQKNETIQNRTEALDSLSETYEKSIEDLLETKQDLLNNLDSLAREMEINELTALKSNLEFEAALHQYSLGVIDARTLERHEIQLRQAELNYWDSIYQYDLAVRRLNSGILGDLVGLGIGGGGR